MHAPAPDPDEHPGLSTYSCSLLRHDVWVLHRGLACHATTVPYCIAAPNPVHTTMLPVHVAGCVARALAASVMRIAAFLGVADGLLMVIGVAAAQGRCTYNF